MLDNTSYIIFKKFKSSTEIMLSQKLNLIQSDNLQELVCTITSCEFKFLIQRIFSIFLEKSQIVSAVYKWQRIQSSGSGKKSNTVKRTTAENVNRVYRRPGRLQLQTGSEECGSVSRPVETLGCSLGPVSTLRPLGAPINCRPRIRSTFNITFTFTTNLN